jgi:hypothetical protein
MKAFPDFMKNPKYRLMPRSRTLMKLRDIIFRVRMEHKLLYGNLALIEFPKNTFIHLMNIRDIKKFHV